MGSIVGPNLLNKDDIVIYYDIRNRRSWDGSATRVYSLVGSGYFDMYESGMIHSENTVDEMLEWDGIGERDGSPQGSNLIISSEALTKSTNYADGMTYFWVQKLIAAQTYGQCIFWGSSTIRHIEIKGEGGSGYFRTEAAMQNGYSFGASGIGMTTGTWQTLAVVFNNDVSPRTVQWYRDGDLKYTDSNFDDGTGGTSEYFSFSRIGRATGSSSYMYSQSLYGYVPIFICYGTNLTGNEIKKLHYMYKGRFVS